MVQSLVPQGFGENEYFLKKCINTPDAHEMGRKAMHKKIYKNFLKKYLTNEKNRVIMHLKVKESQSLKNILTL